MCHEVKHGKITWFCIQDKSLKLKPASLNQHFKNEIVVDTNFLFLPEADAVQIADLE